MGFETLPRTEQQAERSWARGLQLLAGRFDRVQGIGTSHELLRGNERETRWAKVSAGSV